MLKGSNFAVGEPCWVETASGHHEGTIIDIDWACLIAKVRTKYTPHGMRVIAGRSEQITVLQQVKLF